MTLDAMTHCDNAATERSVAGLQKRFPHWWVWVSDTGTWWASRRAQLTSAEREAGAVPYLRAMSADELAALLAQQHAPLGGSS